MVQRDRPLATMLFVFSGIHSDHQELLFSGTALKCPTCQYANEVTTYFHEPDTEHRYLLGVQADDVNKVAEPQFDIVLYNTDRELASLDNGQVRVTICRTKEKIANGHVLVKWAQQSHFRTIRALEFVVTAFLLQEVATSTMALCEIAETGGSLCNGTYLLSDVAADTIQEKDLYGLILQNKQTLQTRRLPNVQRPHQRGNKPRSTVKRRIAKKLSDLNQVLMFYDE